MGHRLIVPAPLGFNSSPALQATSPNTSEIDLTALVGRSDVTAWRFEFALNVNGPWSVLGTQGSPIIAQNGLQPATVYFYRARALFATGRWSAYSPTIAQQTGPAVGGTHGTPVKWNPGHYVASFTNVFPGTTFAGELVTEMSPLANPWCMGFRPQFTWAALDAGPVNFTTSVGGALSGTLTSAVIGSHHPNPGAYWVAFYNGATLITYRQCSLSGVTLTWGPTVAGFGGNLPAGTITSAHLYDTAALDGMIAKAKTGFAFPKQIVFTVILMSFNGGPLVANDFSIVPTFLRGNKALYGNSPDPNASGHWGVALTGPSNGTYAAAVWRTNVAIAYGQLGAALGAKYDSEPCIEGIMDQEDSAVVQCSLPAHRFGAANPNDPTYPSDDSAYVTAMKLYYGMWRAKFPTTNIIGQNTYLNLVDPTQRFEDWMIRGGLFIAPSAADTIGDSHFAVGDNSPASWGLTAYAGVTLPGSTWTGPDSRIGGFARAMVDVESPDYGYTVPDLLKSLNGRYAATHAFWVYINTATWNSNVAPTISANPLINSSYPKNYPQP